ncbi:hypothetical protein HPP92_026343 [Vanilla planifolia]|uniref:Uncharacterized protein n=1 Tax=Vanilla planifolia TaxID=51239 RepID=A0A835PGC7_VANPL|nr:hypothetical protein HPP92_026565 [Vanilla planifolia]KAG0451187.1 hypothetical protein HPP92_026343 [Vanilla planifolia]
MESKELACTTAMEKSPEACGLSSISQSNSSLNAPPRPPPRQPKQQHDRAIYSVFLF